MRRMHLKTKKFSIGNFHLFISPFALDHVSAASAIETKRNSTSASLSNLTTSAMDLNVVSECPKEYHADCEWYITMTV